MKYFKFTLSLLALMLVTQISFALPTKANTGLVNMEEYQSMSEDIKNMNLESFMDLTPKKYREMTGKKMGFKNALALKAAQKMVKKQQRKAPDDDLPKGVFILFAVLVPIAAVIFMGLWDDWEGNTWWTALLLYFLCYIPGLIYTLTKVKNYY